MTFLRLLPFVCLAGLSAAGCATAPDGRDAEKAEQALASEESAQRDKELQLYGHGPQGARPPCDRACPVPEGVCGHAARICQMAIDRRGSVRAKDACEDATLRCERVRHSVSAQCDCRAVATRATTKSASPGRPTITAR
jgi:hypothetical protein